MNCVTWVKSAVAWVFCIACICYGVNGQSALKAYCFEFTWLGPTFTNETIVNNATCEEIPNSPSVCQDPLVYTYDGTPPNLTNMWVDSELRTRTTCELSKGEVCAKWTFEYNNFLENVTYLCTKVTVDSKWPMTSGCKVQNRGGRRIEVCACETQPGTSGSLVFPCNAGPPSLHQAAPLLLLAVVGVLTLLTR
ncbi:uncharacterized protein LOC135936440 [Cloeon dipterum]|uniref:uncharacterized protein LOC135936440 n=1 Tax=Cloeon dipterum TaxID=197152 RepID=UPI00321FE12C